MSVWCERVVGQALAAETHRSDDTPDRAPRDQVARPACRLAGSGADARSTSFTPLRWQAISISSARPSVSAMGFSHRIALGCRPPLPRSRARGRCARCRRTRRRGFSRSSIVRAIAVVLRLDLLARRPSRPSRSRRGRRGPQRRSAAIDGSRRCDGGPCSRSR